LAGGRTTAISGETSASMLPSDRGGSDASRLDKRVTRPDEEGGEERGERKIAHVEIAADPRSRARVILHPSIVPVCCPLLFSSRSWFGFPPRLEAVNPLFRT